MGSARTAPNPKFEEDLKAATEMPEGMGRTTSILNAFTGGSNIMGRTSGSTMSGLGASGGTGIQNAISGIVSPSASASIKTEQDKEDTREVTSSQSSDFDMDKVRERLLAKAKEERTARSQQYSQEKQVYNQSLPDSAKQMQMFVGGDMADKDEFMRRTGLTPVEGFQNRAKGV